MIPAHSSESASDSAAFAALNHPLSSAYYARLHPWLIIRHLPNMQRLAVARFRHRSEAEMHLQALRRLMPTADYQILFDPGEAETEY